MLVVLTDVSELPREEEPRLIRIFIKEKFLFCKAEFLVSFQLQRWSLHLCRSRKIKAMGRHMRVVSPSPFIHSIRRILLQLCFILII